MRSKWRFAIAVTLLGGAALLLHARNSVEIIPAHAPLSSFPQVFDGWTSTDMPISKDVLDILGPGDFLLRGYRHSGSNADIDLFIAYFPSQRSGDTIHSPKHCLPGSGWTPIQSDRIAVAVAGQAPFLANRYLISKGEDRQLVLYWYWAHNRAVASEYSAKFYLVADSIRMHRTDGSMIRVSTSMAENESIDSAQQRLLSFAGNITPVVYRYVPR